ncbi:MAG: acylphosphatase, partial [Thermoproteus sp.]|nr:acylphosphatase [Thermoproteus sp.]
ARAAALGLYGYARNLPDGRVEVMAEGDVERIKQLAEALCPPGARCKIAEMSWEEYKGEFKDFEVL